MNPTYRSPDRNTAKTDQTARKASMTLPRQGLVQTERRNTFATLGSHSGARTAENNNSKLPGL